MRALLALFVAALSAPVAWAEGPRAGESVTLRAESGWVPACVGEASYRRFRAAIDDGSAAGIRRLHESRGLFLLPSGAAAVVVEADARPLAGDHAPGPAVVVRVPGRPDPFWVPSLYVRGAGSRPSYFESWMPALSPPGPGEPGPAVAPGVGRPCFGPDAGG